MTEKDKKIFTKLLVSLAEFYQTELSKVQIDMYFNALKYLTLEQFRIACNVVAGKCRYFPRPVDFREVFEVSVETKAYKALELVETAIAQCGIYATVCFPEDFLIHHVINAMGGWIKLCEMDEEDWDRYGRKEFVRIYKTFADDFLGLIQSSQTPQLLYGLHTLENNKNGASYNRVFYVTSQGIEERKEAIPTTTRPQITEEQVKVEVNKKEIPLVLKTL